MIVGFTGYIMVPFAKLISRKPVVFDALCTIYEMQIISRNANRKYSLGWFYVLLIDWCAVHFADLVLVETESQRQHFLERFKISGEKCKVLYTGADNSIFYFDHQIEKRNNFTALFRGGLTKEAGVKYIIEAAKILENSGINFLILGHGWGEVKKEIDSLLEKYKLKNFEIISRKLEINEMRILMSSCHVSLGQFENNERLAWTIPHKAFESLAMKLPYITARAAGVSEVFMDEKNCLMVNMADSKDLAEKVLKLKNDSILCDSLANSGLELYNKSFTPKVLAKRIIDLLININN